MLLTCTWPPVEGVDLALHIHLHQPAGVGRCRVRTSEEGRVKNGAAALMSAAARQLIVVDLRRVCAHANRLWSWRGGGWGSQGDLNIYCRFPESLDVPPERRSLPVFVVPGVFSSSPLPFINTGTPVVFSRDYFLCLFLCLLNSLFCRHIYCFLYLEPSSAFYTFPFFPFFFIFANLRHCWKKQTNKNLTSFIFARPTNEQPRPWQTHPWL